MKSVSPAPTDFGVIEVSKAPHPVRRVGPLAILLSGKFLLVSIIMHIVAGLAATYFIVQHTEARKQVTFKAAATTTSPSTRALEHKVSVARKQNTMSAPAQPKRIASRGLAKITLPEMPVVPMNTGIVPGKMAGMGGTGMGMGRLGGGACGGGGGGGTMFGFKSKQSAALVGRLYDLKQLKDGHPTDIGRREYSQFVNAFAKGGWREEKLREFYQAKNALYATQIMTPEMPADAGPEAFGVEKEVQPRYWLAHYKGRVSPPESGKFYFVGGGDDVMIVRFNGRVVLDRGWEMQLQIPEPLCKNTADYNYEGTGIPHGFARGAPIEVRAGQFYPIEILIGEEPGGRFFAALLFEKEGASYEKDARGNPILPVFRTSAQSAKEVSQEEACAPFQPNGPIWKAQDVTKLGGL